MALSTLDMFCADPAGVVDESPVEGTTLSITHYEALYSDSNVLLRRADTFVDKSAPTSRSLSYAGYTMSSKPTNNTLTAAAFPNDAAASPITPSGDFIVMVPVRLGYAALEA